jgi:hypothetical protein
VQYVSPSGSQPPLQNTNPICVGHLATQILATVVMALAGAARAPVPATMTVVAARAKRVRDVMLTAVLRKDLGRVAPAF